MSTLGAVSQQTVTNANLLADAAPAQNAGNAQNTQNVAHVRTFAQMRQNPLANAGARDQVRHAQPTLSEKIKNFFHELKPSIRRTGGLPPEVTVNLGNGGTVSYKNTELASMIKALPISQRAAARVDLPHILAGRLTHAEQLVTDITTGQYDRTQACTIDQASDIMLLLDAKARATGNEFSAGAFKLDDANGALYNFLDTCPEKYLRSSSHLKTEQRTQISTRSLNGDTVNHANIHRGIDIPPGPAGLPYAKRTILFAAHNPNSTDRGLYIKAEEHGARISTLKKNLSNLGSSGNPSRAKHLSDVGQMFGHLSDFIHTRGQEAAGGSRKERIPPVIKESYQQMCTAALDAHLTFVPAEAAKDTAGVSNMLIAARHLNAFLSSRANLMTDDAKNALRENIHDLIDTCARSLTNADNLHSRIGNEMIFNATDIITPLHQDRVNLQTFGEKQAAIARFVGIGN